MQGREDDYGEVDDGGLHDYVEDALPREGGAETAQSKKGKSGKTSYKKGEKVRKIKEGAGDLAALF